MRAGALAAGLLAAAALLLPGAAGQVREAATDALMRLLPRPGEAPPVLMVEIDEAALAASPWPWPRDRLAALVAALAAAGAGSVALDMALDQPEPGDAALAARLREAGGIAGALAGTEAPPGPGVALAGQPDLGALLTLPGLAAPPLPGVPAAFAALPGSPVRAVPLLVRLDAAPELPVPGLALAAVLRATGRATLLLTAGPPPGMVLGGVSLPLPRDGMLRLHPGRAPPARIGAARVLAGDLPDLDGHVAVIGVTAPEVAPLRPSVFGDFTPSLRLQAEAAGQLAQGWVPLRPGWARFAEAALASGFGVLAAAAMARRAAVGLVMMLGLLLAGPALAAAVLQAGPRLADPLLPAAGALAGGLVQGVAEARRLARDRARLLARFASRVPAGVADRLLAMPEAERLRPERRAVAIIITDLADFSTMVRRARPEALVAVLNAYLAGVEACVVAEGGTLERLIGDSVLAVFGAPVVQPDHAARALATARAIDAFAEAFRARPEAAALGFGATRIGVAAGEVLVGELGGSRLTWSVCGDAANIAARLQELGKQIGRRALVTGIEDASLPPPLGRFALRGFEGEHEVRPLG